MRREEILRILDAHQAELGNFVGSLALFGSAARGEVEAGSDVDILIKFDGPPTFERFMDVKFYQEDLLGRRVDLVTHSALKPRLRPRIEEEAVYVTGFPSLPG
jgi:hypothetical protein